MPPRRNRVTQKQASRRDARNARRATRKNKQRLLRGGVLALLGLVALALIGGLLLSPGLFPSSTDRKVLTAEDRLTGPGTHHSEQTSEHISENSSYRGYNSVPGTSGPHWAIPAEWGLYSEPLPEERIVHNLEHGGIGIHYPESSDASTIQSLENIAKNVPGYPSCIVVSPHVDVSEGVVLTAWAVTLETDGGSVDEITNFIDFYRDQGPERVNCRDVIPGMNIN